MPTPQEIIEAWKKANNIELKPEQEKSLLEEMGKSPTQEDWSRFLTKEREVTQMESTFKGREKTLAEREEAAKKWEGQMQEYQKDPVGWLEKNADKGLFEEWYKRIVADGKPDPVAQLQREIEALKEHNQKLQESIDGNQQTFDQRQQQEQIAKVMVEFDGIIADKKFDVIRQYGGAYEKFAGQKIDLHQVAKSIAVQHFEKHKDEIESGRMQELTLNQIADTMLSEAQARWDGIPEPAKQALQEDPAQQTGKEKEQQQQQAGDEQHFSAVDNGQQASEKKEEAPSQQALTAADETQSPPVDFESMTADERLEHTKTHGLPTKFK